MLVVGRLKIACSASNEISWTVSYATVKTMIKTNVLFIIWFLYKSDCFHLLHEFDSSNCKSISVLACILVCKL